MSRALRLRLIGAACIAAMWPFAATFAATTATFAGWHLTTSQLQTNAATGDFTITSRLTLARDDGSTVEADSATGNFRQRRVNLSGHVVLHDISGTLSRHAITGGNGPITLTSDHLDIDELKKLYVATGSVHYSQGTRTVDTDRAVFDEATGSVQLSGASHMTGAAITFGDWTMNTASLDANNQTGSFNAPGHVQLRRADGSTVDADRADGNFKTRQVSLYGNVAMHDTSGKLVSAGGANAAQKAEPSSLFADRLDIDRAHPRYHASGHVRYEQGARKINCDDLVVDNAANRIHLKGAVHVVQAAAEKAPSTGWTLDTARVDADSKSGEFVAPEHVALVREDGSTIDADRAKGNYKGRVAQLFGNVKVHDVSGNFGLASAKGASHEAATLASDELRVDGKARVYDADGNVHFTQGTTTADAERAHLNDVAHRLDLAGKVHVVQADRRMYADRATYDTLSGKGVADGAVRMEFPGITPTIATPKPIVIKKPKIP